ncbi:ABC transporter permease, partial [Sinorhizobium medicae]
MNLAALAGAILFWLAAWALNQWLVQKRFASNVANNAAHLAVPLLFGITILVLWEGIVRGFAVPSVLLPAPSMIWLRLINSLPTLAADFRQTFLKSVLTGYALGCGLGFIVAILIDRSPFLQKGLLPLGNFVSALPVIGVAPIMVMWFGFDWPAK